MKLENRTPFPAHLFRTTIDDDRLAAAVIARVTFDVEDGICTVAPEQVWQVSPGPWEGPHGPMEGDDVFVRGGVDLLVFGHARPPSGVPTDALTVAVEVGAFRRALWVYGNRVWERDAGDLRPSSPEPFSAMPLHLSHAFGGKDSWDGLDVPFPDNPDGKGFYLSEEAALGGPLPNLEDPQAPIQSWQDQPGPVGLGLCPGGFGKRLENFVFSEEGLLQEIRPAFFNAAFPEMILPSLTPGETVFLHGVSEDGLVRVEVPDLDLEVRLTFGDEVTLHTPRIDQIGIEADLARVFITLRYAFRYTMHPHQIRCCELIREGHP